MSERIRDERIITMQQDADRGLQSFEAPEVSLAEHVNYLLDERANVMLPEIARLTALLAERTGERDRWRSTAEEALATSKRAAEGMAEAIAALHGGTTDAASEVRAALLAMPDANGSTATIRGIKVERTGTGGWAIGDWSGTPRGRPVGGLEWAVTAILDASK